MLSRSQLRKPSYSRPASRKIYQPPRDDYDDYGGDEWLEDEDEEDYWDEPGNGWEDEDEDLDEWYDDDEYY